jgi:hypothetical protein
MILRSAARFLTILFAAGAPMLFAAPIETVDLASSSAWSVSIDGGASQTVTVPGHTGMSDNAVFRRSITIPASAAGKVVKVLFGAVDYGGDVYLGSTLITSHKNLMLPFEADLTGKVTAGSTYTLEVRAYSRSHYGNKIPNGCWWTRLAHGINRYVKMVVLPPVYIKDVFIQPSVRKDCLNAEIWVHNSTTQSRTISLDAALTSWNSRAWSYPSVPSAAATLPANAVTRVHIGPVPWGLGAQSYWWPNIPFSETYAAQLHNLLLSLKENGSSIDTAIQRFGFVEYTEGPYYYLVNGVRIGFQPSDGTPEAQYGYDAYSVAPYFSTLAGCKESWKRYMRLGVNTYRTHSSIPTENIMNAADEIGFWLIPESGLRCCEQAGIWDSATYTDDVREMVLATRDHPCICRYSIDNEYVQALSTDLYVPLLIDAAWEHDTTRPLVEEGRAGSPERTYGKRSSGHSVNMLHYTDPRGFLTRRYIVGLGEYAYDIGGNVTNPSYCSNGDLMREADIGLDLRKNDLVYAAIWDFYVYWRNMLTESSPSIAADKYAFLQRCLHPYVACDSAYDKANICYASPWPSTIPALTTGATAFRKIYLFNGGVRGSKFKLVWELRWGSATGALAATGSVDTTIDPGFHVTVPVSFTVPATTASASPITVSGGTEMYKETRYYFSVSGSNLYFVLRSFLMPPLSRFAVRPASLELSGTLSGDIAVTSAEGTLPALTAQSAQPWLTALVSGQGPAQVIRVTASGLAPGLYSGSVVLSAPGYEPVTCMVTARVDGTPAASIISIMPTHTSILPSSTANFSANVIDQFGAPISPAIDWSVSGGGAVDASGLFTSNGTPGDFIIRARVRSDTAKSARASVTVTQGKLLPAGNITELLCLVSAQNSLYLYWSKETDSINAIITGNPSYAPCHGLTLAANTTTYTWRSMSSPGGVWLTGGLSLVYSFVSLRLLNPLERTVKMVVSHDDRFDAWMNGDHVVNMPGWTQPGATETATITLPKGSSVFIFRRGNLDGASSLSMKFTDASNNALSDVRYCIDTCNGQVLPAAQGPCRVRAPIDMCAVRVARGAIEIAVTGLGAHTIEVVTPQGQIVTSLHGTGAMTCRVPKSAGGSGVYLIKMQTGTRRFVRKLVVW